MKQEAAPQEASLQIRGKEQRLAGIRLGPLLCWAVVFANVGTSIYYVPGILYGKVGNLAGFFVMLTMSVFVLLTLKYAQVISLLGGHWGNIALQTEVAISASALLIFAGHTAIIGSYHVFLALSRMEFFPQFIQQRNKLRGTPHFSILLAIAILIGVLIAVQGAITVLGDL